MRPFSSTSSDEIGERRLKTELGVTGGAGPRGGGEEGGGVSLSSLSLDEIDERGSFCSVLCGQTRWVNGD